MAIRDFFAPGGPLAERFPKYEARPEQVAMAEAVFEAATKIKPLVVEAGTGVGKSMGYLVPIIEIIKDNRTVRAEIYDPVNDETKVEDRPRRMIVSTHSINLQKQLFDKELPLLKSIYPWLSYSMAVGSENYLCGARLKKALGDVGTNPLIQGEIGDLEKLDAWSRETQTGLRMDIGTQVSHEAWGLVNRQADFCRCKKWDPATPCFYRKARLAMNESNVIIVNHHLLMAALTIENGAVLPGHDYVVVDELHSLEEVATQCFGVEISNYKIDRLMKDTRRVVRNAGSEVHRADEINEVMDICGRAADSLFYVMKQQIEAAKKDSLRLRQKLPIDLTNVELIEQLARAAKLVKEAGDEVTDPQKAHEVKAVAKRTAECADQVKSWLLQSEEDHVYQIISEKGGKRLVAKSNPIDISEELNKCLWAQPFVTIGTSATVSTSGNMKFVKEKLGAGDAQEMVLASPFDYVNNAMIYIAADLPEAPREQDPNYYNALVQRCADLVQVSNGRAMILCTSNQSMKTLGQRLRGMLPGLRIMIQGEELERHQMVEELKRNNRSVIVATSSFWQGVDIAGDALQMVIMIKLPFPNVGDPLFEARAERIDAVRPGTFRSFNKMSIPEMIIKLKQGFGRLIRTSTDYGCVAILDPRVITKKYGSTVLGSLPRTHIKYQIDDVKAFFAHRTPAPAQEQPPIESEIEEVPF